jgi:hypothetical protein
MLVRDLQVGCYAFIVWELQILYLAKNITFYRCILLDLPKSCQQTLEWYLLQGYELLGA